MATLQNSYLWYCVYICPMYWLDICIFMRIFNKWWAPHLGVNESAWSLRAVPLLSANWEKPRLRLDASDGLKHQDMESQIVTLTVIPSNIPIFAWKFNLSMKLCFFFLLILVVASSYFNPIRSWILDQLIRDIRDAPILWMSLVKRRSSRFGQA